MFELIKIFSSWGSNLNITKVIKFNSQILIFYVSNIFHSHSRLFIFALFALYSVRLNLCDKYFTSHKIKKKDIL